MSSKMVGVILTGGKKPGMKELVTKRSVSAVPVGGKYRAIDFALSNMVNSNIYKVGILTQYSFRSLMDHIGSGKQWDLDRKNAGIFMFMPYLSDDDASWYRGTADGLFKNLTYFNRTRAEYVLLASGNCVYKMDYEKLLEKHKESGADISVVYRDMSDLKEADLSNYGMIDLDENERIVDFNEKPAKPSGTNASLGIYLLKRELLIDLLVESNAKGRYDFVKDILIRKIDKLDIRGVRYMGYWRALNSIPMYYRCNMELIDPKISTKLFTRDWPIYTKVKDETPAKYNEEAMVKSSVVADGCIIEGEVYNSVLSRGVVVRKGASVKNSIVMQGSIIEEGASLEHAILDKDVVIKAGKSLKGEGKYPVIIGKRTVVE